MDQRRFSPGFRLSTMDVVIIVVGGIASAFVSSIDLWIGIAITFVVLHFFLFCNVIRMSRPLELIWAGVFAMLALTASLEIISWPIVFACSILLTITLTTIQTRRMSYHGVGWRRINPTLLEWWEKANRS